MDFRTEFIVKPLKSKITYKDRLFFLGSCFAENMGLYFQEHRFRILTNPFGVLFHPLAIERLIDIALNENYNPNHYSFQHQDLWSNFDAHSSLSSTSKSKLAGRLKAAKMEAEKALLTSDVLFVSLGTAWIYKHIKQNKVVANCHKIPQKQFKKQRLKTSEIVSALENIIRKIKTVNPTIKIIFTLSPVRHLKDGFIENQLSKSTLHVAIHEVLESHNDLNYFPSYELLLDDLRDYRFYDKDLLHPNESALDYIWEKLCQSIFEEKTLETLERVKAINRRLNHRFFNSQSKASLAFKEKTEDLIKGLSRTNPEINF